MSLRAVLLWLLPGLLLGAVVPRQAHCAEGEDARTGLRFRRVLAPEQRIRDWPVGGEKYLPLDTAEFDRLLSIAPSTGAKSPAPPAAGITTAKYHARLEGDQLVAGQAAIDVALFSQTPALLPWEPCNLAIGKAFWADKSPAALGLGSDGKTQLQVVRSGQLRFDWSLAGKRDPAEIIGFAFELPRSAANELILTLPEGVTPASDAGIVLGSEPAGEKMRQWRIELGGHGRFRLRMFPAGGAGQRPPLVLLRESCTYDLSLRGLEFSAQWRLQAHNEPLHQVTVLLDPGLQLATARYGDVAVPWIVTPGGDGQAARAVLSLPEPIQDSERVLRLGALAPLVLDRPWRLPRICAEGVSWQEGKLTLLAPEPLAVNRLWPLGCAQTATSPLSAPRVGESTQFQCYNASATLEIVLARRAAAAQMAAATDVELGGDEIAARVAADFRLAEGAKPSLQGIVSRNWIVDAVESAPASAISDWAVEPQADGSGALTVRLATALSPSRPVRLIVSTRRRPAPPAQRLALNELLPLRFREVSESRHLVSLRSRGPYDLKLSGTDELKRIDPDKLAEAEAGLFASPPRELLLEYDSRARDLKIRLAVRKPKYSAAIRVEATVGDRSLQETYSFRCLPDSMRVGRVLVQFFPRRAVPPRWTFGSEDEQSITARPWTKDEQTAAGIDSLAEVWELSLRRPRSVPFEIAATRETTYSERQSLSLASLPESSSQRGMVLVHALGQTLLKIDTRLKPIPPEPPAPNRIQTVQGAYRYDPAYDAAPGPEAAIGIATADDATTARAWVGNCRLESWFESDGTARHAATYEVQNSRCGSLELELPAGTAPEDVHGVWIDGKEAAGRRSRRRECTVLTVDLPPGRKSTAVALQWTTSAAALGTVGTLSPPLPDVSLPVLATDWTAWLPRGYDFHPEDIQSPRTAGWTWSGRLFGPLGRAAGAARFDPLSSGDVEDYQGWTVCHVEIGTSPTWLRYAHRDSIRLFAVLTFLLMVAASCWRVVDRPVLLISLLGAFAAAALVLPQPFAPIGSAGVLGMLFCLVKRCVLRRDDTPAEPVIREKSPRSTPGSTVSGSVRLGAFVLAIATGALASAAARGEDPAPIYRVFVPIDAHQKPVGDKVYLPEPFYRQLHRRAAVASEASQGWLILAATYRGVLAREAASGRLVVESLKAQYDLQVFGRGVRVRIPFRGDGANLLPNGATLDGRVIEPGWGPEGVALAFKAAEPGPYRLELSLRPAMRNGSGPAGFDLSIPRVAASRLELAMPADAPAVETPTACGAVRFERDPPRLLAGLGPTDRLAVRWQEGGAAKAAAIDIEQLLWLKVLPGSVVLDAKFKLRIAGGQFQQLQLVADPRLRLLPLKGDDPPSVEVRQGLRQTRLITLRWPRPLTAETTLEATLLLTGTSGVGKFRLPQLDVADVRVAKCSLAVSVDPVLEREEQHQEGLKELAVSEFLRAWGRTEAKPQSAYRRTAEVIDWSLSTRPREPSTTADQSLDLSFDRDDVELRFDAQLATTSGYVFQYRLAAPPGLNVERMSLLEEGVERAGRWLQDSDGALTLFLTGPVSGKQKLALRGRLPMAARKNWPVPPVHVQQCQVRSSLVQLFRRPPVLLTWHGQTQPEPGASPTADASRADLGQLAATFKLADSGFLGVTVTVTPNRPRVRAQQMLALRGSGRSWNAEVECRLQVGGGTVDLVRLRAPAPWNGPYSVQPPGTLTVVDVPGEGRQVVFQPQSPITGNGSFTISGPLELARGDRPSAPDVALQQVDTLQRWVILPRKLQGQPTTWQTQGLRPTEPADHFPAAARAGSVIYAVIGDPVQAVLQPQSPSPQAAVVRLADISAAWLADGSCQAVAVFDLEPGGLAECPLRMPDGCELVQALIDGTPVAARAGEKGIWRLPLTSQRLPQRVEVVFRGRIGDTGGGQHTLQSPSLGDLPVRQTLWNVAGPPSFSAGVPQEGESLAPWKRHWLRLKNVAGAIETAALASADDPEETSRWYPIWVRRFVAARAAMNRELAPDNTDATARIAQKELAAIDRQQQQVAERLDAVETYKEISAAAPAVDGAGDLWPHTLGDAPESTRCVFEGRADSIALDYRWPEGDRLWPRLAAAALIVLGSLLAALRSYSSRGA
jgi:hypothetical protein